MKPRRRAQRSKLHRVRRVLTREHVQLLIGLLLSEEGCRCVILHRRLPQHCLQRGCVNAGKATRELSLCRPYSRLRRGSSGEGHQRSDLLRGDRHLLLCADHDDEPLVGKEAGRRALLEQRKDVTARRGLDLLEDGAGFADDLAGVRILYGDVIANVALDAFEPLDMRVGCVVEVGRWPIGKEDLPSLRGDRLPRRAAACSCRASRHTSHMRERARRERARRHPECTSRCRRRIGQSTTAERA
mmetsp:Transcript_14764/g.33747  ORF Transcript_14764/g.33747 Transcript_14764/m.33747 type:complete len:243 (+) Transcript_14764:432-1160(+)